MKTASELETVVARLVREVATLRRQVRELVRAPRAPRDNFKSYPGPGLSEGTMNVHQAAQELGLGEEQVRRLLRDDKLAGIPLGGRAGWVINRQSVADMKARRQG